MLRAARKRRLGERAESSSLLGGHDNSPFAPSSSRRLSSIKNECVTTVEPVVLVQRWTVNNFESLIKLSQPGVCLRSSVFRDNALPDACWQLCLYPGGKREENANHVSLFLKMSATAQMKEVLVKAEYRFYFLDDNDEAKFSNVNIGEFHAKPPKGGHSWGLRNIPRQKVQNSIRSDKSLVISCCIELIPDVTKVPCKKMPATPVLQRHCMEVPKGFIDAELEMLRSGEGADMEICAGAENTREVFRTHSYKLISHSAVFRAMLSHDSLQETQDRKITISDFSSMAVRVMLEFLYTGTLITNLEVEDAAEVMQIADKYALSELKKTCEQQLLGRLAVANVLECVTWADTLGANSLLEACLDYIAANRQKIMNLSTWRQFLNSNTQLGNVVMERMVYSVDVPPVKKSRM
ncbi:unnamed protein product [Caenorhabditis auriculariae]|uniref:BTB domain-containing protein n=1 Tax=Caenorhabditis auriculariae TaxID=2777116 RepID=A0A8S1GQ74_9PELO|nr:unnamed protein product [Caenorhabditis auriculariae]